MQAEVRRWGVPAMVVAFGVFALAVGIAAGNVGTGAFVLAVLVAYALALRLGGRSALVRMTRGEGDERDAVLVAKANALFVNVVGAVAVGGAIVEQVAGDGPGLFTLFCVATGVFYVLVLGVLRARG